MHSFQELSIAFANYFGTDHFPQTPGSLYDPNRYFLQLGGKRIRPILVLMGNELFDDIKTDAWPVANAIELFHNFTLIHDDIMDAAPLRRGMPTVHEKYGTHTALLAGDVMLVKAYEYLNQVDKEIASRIIKWFNTTATQVCEGQQLDMDFEKRDDVALEEYIHMIALKTSVLLAGALRMGAIIGGAGKRNADHLYEFGKNLGIAFQIQDDYLDAFGDPEKFGKQVGGDIISNKKTFLLINALSNGNSEQVSAIKSLLEKQAPDKVEKMLGLYRQTGADTLTRNLQKEFFDKAMFHLEEIAVVSSRKKPLMELAEFLIARDY
ncbi:MAG: polyprenyl synthetase family protein [Chitinophagaceae bacterium]|jgi:geranylgeranyl diphosphate synthase type II|nr:polyprenyl synthetase family protein [Chitinophagaceae bacterium]MCU0405163.1 polyprenyl synthetase family protein [Chitinophagaceae bacterium]